MLESLSRRPCDGALATCCLVLCMCWGAFTANPATASDQAPGEAALHFMMARMYLAEGDVEAALAEYRAAIRLDTSDFVLHVELAAALESAGQVDDAVAELEVARTLAAGEPIVHRRLGETLVQRAIRSGGRDRDALARGIAALEELRRLDPADLPGMALLAQAYRRTRRVSEAIEVLENLVSYHSDNLQLKQLLVDVLEDAGQKERAGDLLREMMLLQQSTVESQLELARIEAERQDFSTAIGLVEDALAQAAGDIEAQHFLVELLIARAVSTRQTAAEQDQDLVRAATLIDRLPPERREPLRVRLAIAQGRPQEAIALLKKTAERSSDPADFVNLADLLVNTHRVEEAIAVLNEAGRRFAAQEKKVAPLAARLVQLLAREGRWAAAAVAAAELARVTSGAERVQATRWRIEALDRAGDHDGALSLLRVQRRADPDSVDWALRESELLTDQDRKKEARRILEREPLRSVSDSSSWIRVCRQWFLLAPVEAASEVVERFVAAGSSTDSPDRHFAAGRCLSMAEQFAAAAEYLARAAELVESGSDLQAEVRFWLGQAYERSGNFEAAAEQFEEVLTTRQDDATTMNYLGYMWAERGMNLERALELVERAVSIEPANGSYVDSLGWVQYRLGRLDDARRSLQQAAELSPGNAVILEHLGDVFAALGEHDEAARAYERALALRDEENERQVEAKLKSLQRDGVDG